MKNFSKGLFGFIIALCFTLTAFCMPQPTTLNHDVGYSCVNQSFSPATAINCDIYLLTAIPNIAVTSNAIIINRLPVLVKNVGAALVAAQGSNTYLLLPKLTLSGNYQIKTTQFSQGIYRLDIGEINAIRLNVSPYQTTVTTWNKNYNLTTASVYNKLINPVPLL